MQQSYCYLTSLGFLGGETRWKRKRKIKEQPGKKDREPEMLFWTQWGHMDLPPYFLLLLFFKEQIEGGWKREFRHVTRMKAEMFTSPIGLQCWLTQDATRQVQIDPTHSGHNDAVLSTRWGLWLHLIHLQNGDDFWLQVKREVCSAWVLNIITKMNIPSHVLKGSFYNFFIKLYNLALVVGFFF